MNKEKILKKILEDPDLSKQYWPNVNVEEQNTNTLLRSNNKYLISLYYLFEESNQKSFIGMISKIKTTFQL
jgi:hypothetical protein